MTRCRAGQTRRQIDRIDQIQRREEFFATADHGQRFGVAQMGVGIHEPDLAAKEGRAFSALEQRHGAAAVAHGLVEQTRAVGPQQMLLDEREVMRGLGRTQDAAQYRMGHGQQAVAQAGAHIAGMEQIVLSVAIAPVHIAWHYVVDHEPALKISRNAHGGGSQVGGLGVAATGR